LKRGILSAHIDDSGLCTACENSKFFSYRKESQTPERMLSVMSIR